MRRTRTDLSRASGSSNGLSRRAVVSRWLLACSIAGAANAVGAVHTATICVVTGLLGAAAVLAWSGAEPMRVRTPATALVLTGLGLIVYTAAQCVPMPMRWLFAIAPQNADVWSRALAPLHESGPGWAPISLDPAATRVEVLKGVAYLLAFVAALTVARRRNGIGFLSSAIVATAIVLSVAALVHPAFGAHKLYGLYEPGPGVGDRHLAPLMNPNHLAGYINIGFSLCVAALLAKDLSYPRSVLIAILLFLAATQVWIASRGGVASMVLQAFLIVLLSRTQRQPDASSNRGSIAVGASMLGGAVLVVLGGSSDAKTELMATDISKLDTIRQAFTMLRSFPLFGVGRGAFESVFPRFRDAPGYLSVSHPEDLVAQWSTEWGILVAVAAFVAIGIALRPKTVEARPALALGAWSAIVGTAAQNLCDFSSEVPGVALAVVVCAAMVVAGTPGKSSRRWTDRWASNPRLIAAMAAGASALAIVSASVTIGRDLVNERRQLFQLANTSIPLDVFAARTRAAMLRHPSEPYFPFIAALRATRMRDDQPMPWLNATLERAKVYGPAQLVLARLLANHGLAAQSRLEYRLAAEQEPTLMDVVAVESLRLVRGFDDAMELAPSTWSSMRLLSAIANGCAERLPATTVRLDQVILSHAPGALEPLSRAATAAVDDLEHPETAPWCAEPLRDKCVSDARRAMDALQRVEPSACQPRALRARMLMASGLARSGLDDLEREADETSDRIDCLAQLTLLARAAADDSRAHRAMDRILHAGCDDPADCVRYLSFVAQQHQAMGEPSQALAAYERALEQAPEDDDLLAKIAELAASTGLHAQALKDYERLASRHPEVPSWSAAVEREHRALTAVVQ